VNSNKSTFRNIEWGAWIVVALGGLLLLLGIRRFVLRHHFGFMDAVYCCLALVPIALLLLVIAYVVQHARLASVVPLALAVVLAFASPVFDVALGLALIGAIAGPALSEWKDEKRRQKATPANGGENKEGQ
jgi:nicotinamide riboside transporter PnuC